MPTVLYIHGFLSSPLSAKAQITQAWLQQHRPEWRFECPSLSSYPADARATLEAIVHSLTDEVYLIGSSLGGFWATYLTERYGFPAVLVNPAVSPQRRFTELVGQPLQNYHTGEAFQLREQDLLELEACDTASIQRPERYWLLVQTGDETLDYRHAVERYKVCRQTVEEGGSHTFDGYEHWLDAIVQFFEQSSAAQRNTD